MANVKKAMEYATTFEREALREKLDAALGDLDHMNLIQLQEVVLKHEQQIKDIAEHLLELRKWGSPMMEFKQEMPTKIVGPNLVEILNSAGFYQKKEWVGLTGVEINHIFAANVGYPERMMQEVGALLKDKNT